MATVIFFSPHQDDETLVMGAAIRHHVEAGHEVYVALCTDGSASGARARLSLSVADFVDARDDEMHRAVRKLGVPFDQQLRSDLDRRTDGTLTEGTAIVLLSSAIDAISDPDAWLKGPSDINPAGANRHPDHVAIGQALRAFAEAGHNVRMYVEPWSVESVRNTGKTVSVETCAAPAAVLRALDEYCLSDHTAGMYAVGNISVPSYITMVRGTPVSYVHVP